MIWTLPASAALGEDQQAPQDSQNSEIFQNTDTAPARGAEAENSAPRLNTALPDAPSEPISVDFVANIVGKPENPQLSGTALAAETDRVSHNLRCPVCQGSSVGDSPSLSARNMKDEVRDLLAAGFSADQVVRYFEHSYGEFVRLEPKAEGFNLLVWFGPLLLFLVGAVITGVAIRHFSANGAELAVAGGAGGGSELSDLDEDEQSQDDRPLYDLDSVDPEPSSNSSADAELASYLERVRALSSGDSGGGQKKDS